jgi:glycosyltransferase involved in cell wall biosynthesis
VTITVVVASRNREQYLPRLLESLESQTLKPVEVIIIDASDNFVDLPKKTFSFNLTHIATFDASISRQRNHGVSLISKESEYLAILDDDTYPETTYFEEICGFFGQLKNAVGVSGIPRSSRTGETNHKKTSLLKTIFFLDSFKSGSLTKGGVNVGIRKLSKDPMSVEWLIGCAVYKLDSVRELKYEEEFDGYSLGEDVIYSYRASKKGNLFVLPQVSLPHFEISSMDHYSPQYWRMWTKNRRNLVSIMPGGTAKWISYHWANFGQILILLFDFRSPMRIRFRSIVQMIKGSMSVE